MGQQNLSDNRKKHTESLETIRKEIHSQVIAELDFSKDMSDEQVLDLIDRKILACSSKAPLLIDEMKQLRQDIFHAIRRLDVLQDLLDDTGITEIMINGPDSIFIERGGMLEEAAQHFSSEEKLEDVIQQVVSGCNRVVNASMPVADARLPNGARVNVVVPPVALNGPIMTIRRFPEHPIEMDDLISFGSVSREAAEFLGVLVKSGFNIFISGGTGSGKTTFLNALSAYIPSNERVITIEDNAELQIRHIPNLVRLEARGANVDGCIPVTIRDLIRASLRMRPDRIIVGEVRGGEAIDMINSMNTGHDGSMSTGHANSARDMMSRLETMMLMGMDLPMAAIQSQIISAIDIVVHLGRLRDGSRKLLEIAEILHPGDDEWNEGNGIQLRTLWRFQEKGEDHGRVLGSWIREERLQRTDKLDLAGIQLPE